MTAELVARAIHILSSRRERKLVARNAATLPPGLIDAELFGTVANYPNAGTPERVGLVGEAEGGTLFLDEIGELPQELQAHLLRLLDAGGEYQRLGDSRRRSADVRFIGASNRPRAELKHDLAARLSLRVSVPGLEDRREDVPLLARHLLRTVAARDPHVATRFLSGNGEPQIAVDLMRALVSHAYVGHVRELGALLWQSLATSRGDRAELTDAVRADLATEGGATAGTGPATAREPTVEEIRQALARAHGVKARAWRDLGLPNRHVLDRLMKRHGIASGTTDE